MSERGDGNKTQENKTQEAVPARLLAWYDRHARALPWRAPPGTRPDPYHVWLSEVMLQQTTTATVAPYFQTFTTRWPTVHDLAATARDEVLAAWAGLGYYARARNLHACAQAVSHTHGGVFPSAPGELQKLPGIGPYTAAAVAAIAFDVPAAPLDGNIERVLARLFDIHDPLPGAKPALRAQMAALVPESRPGDFAQAMMDLGATVCQPAAPRCAACPLFDLCTARRAGRAPTLPRKAAKKPRPTRRTIAFWIRRADGRVLLRRRPPRGLLGGMLEVPSTDWVQGAAWDDLPGAEAAPVVARWTPLPGAVRHVFTHFALEAAVWTASLPADTEASGALWIRLDDLDTAGLPTAMRKIAAHAMKQQAL